MDCMWLGLSQFSKLPHVCLFKIIRTITKFSNMIGRHNSHTRNKRIGLLLTEMWLRIELNSTQSYYYY